MVVIATPLLDLFDMSEHWNISIAEVEWLTLLMTA